MRLRYLHLPRCGPLSEAAVVFGREELIANALKLERLGSLNFVVGVNGSGKSSLLRAVYQIFHSLRRAEEIRFPVTIAWDLQVDQRQVTNLLYHPSTSDFEPFIAAFDPVPISATRADWAALVESLASGVPHQFVGNLAVERGRNTTSNPPRLFRLPKRVMAYSSGDDAPWVRIDQRIFQPKDEEEGLYEVSDERPQGWTINQEWSEAQPEQIASLLEEIMPKVGDLSNRLPSKPWEYEHLKIGDSWQFIAAFQPINDVRKKVWNNQQIRGAELDDSYFRISPRHLRFAGIIFTLWQTAKEMANRNEEHERQALRYLLLHQHASDEEPKDARRVLNKIDWFWPTHLSVTYRDADDRVSPRQHQELLCLVALADEVIAQPQGRNRAVISLGPSDRISLSEKLTEAFPLGIPSKALDSIAERVDGCKTGAEALLRLFGEDEKIDSTPLNVFTRLRDWEFTGLLENITLTIKRVHRPEFPDGEPDDVLVTYDQLSDGEQMLLGRMGLLFLLRGQDGSLLLLDEPETHFNDVWKREIVEMIDMGLLNSTEANVIVATHTSIALTDAFAAEVTVLDKADGNISARGVTGGLFGTDPGEVNMNLFRADSSTGSRSVEILDQLLKAEWKGREAELEAILNVLDSSFHRAELRAILKQLRVNPDGAAPT